MKKTILSLMFSLLIGYVMGQPGGIDTSFHVGTGFSSTVTAMATQPDNKIVAGGLFTSYNGTEFKTLARLHPNGAIDSSFFVGATGFNGTIKSIHVLADTSVLVAGGFSMLNSTSVYGIVKLDKNGNIDSTFNISNNINGGITAMDVDVVSGKIYIGGSFTTVNGTPCKHIARLLTNGDLDNSFVVGTGFTGMFGSAPVYSLLIQADNKLLVGGEFLFYQGLVASKLCRIKQNGDIDTAFVNNLGAGFDNNVLAIEQLADGKIVVGGEFTVLQGSTCNKIACLNLDGTPNLSFDIAGGPAGAVYSLKKTPNNKIMVGGSFNFFNGVTDRALVRINANGTRDANFATGTGLTLTANSPTVYDILVAADSNVFVGGYFDKYQDSSYKNIVKITGKGNSALSIPTLTTNTPTFVTNNSAKLGGDVTDNGNSTILENGVCWSTSANPTVSDNFASTAVGTNLFNLFVYNLQDTTQYHVRAYARNSEGYGYGDDVVFKTRSNENYTCGEVTFTYNGTPVTYGTVKGKYGRCWLDRNLGASRVAESTTDQQSYGGFYQWGRQTDGHQNVTSGTTSTLASGTNPTHSDFITVQNTPFDWTSAPDNDLWNGLNAINNPCPTGWRLPTSTEFANEMTLWSEQTNNGAFESALRLPSSGVRGYLSGSRQNEGAWASCWTSEAFASATTNVKMLNAEASQAQIVNTYRAMGANVRCIKDYSNDIQIIDMNKTFYLFPNPVNNTLNIQMKGENNTNGMLSIFDNTGRVVYSQSISGSNQSIDISQIPSGIYFVKIVNNTCQQVERLIVTK
jgi:uncharacterized delta-60 repeat protein/uncharacterized protein (TIGR02145 family)